MKKIRAITGPMRLPFLLLTPSCVVLGAGVSYWKIHQIDIPLFVLILLGAVCAHISVNAFNEYFDWKSGLDHKTLKTPFSGGSGTLPDDPSAVPYALVTAWVSFFVTLGLGIYFVWLKGWLLIPLGIAGMLSLILYTIWFTKNPFLCLITPGLGFGIFMVMGTEFVLSGMYSWAGFFASLTPFFLVNDLLLLNQFPDVEPDRSTGRRHIPVMYGIRTASIIYGIFLVLSYFSIITGVLFGFLPWASLIGLLTLPLGLKAFLGAYRYGDNVKRLLPYMGMNVIINLATPALVGVGLFIS